MQLILERGDLFGGSAPLASCLQVTSHVLLAARLGLQVLSENPQRSRFRGREKNDVAVRLYWEAAPLAWRGHASFSSRPRLMPRIAWLAGD